jgi:NitT/TauT family transport system substrate-binding protein
VPGTSSSAAAPTGSGTITVAATAGAGDAPLYIAIKNGLFRQQGLNVRVLPESSFRSEVSDLDSGRAQIAFGDYADMFYAQQQAQKKHQLNIIAEGYDAAPNVMEILTMPGTAANPGISTPAALSGKTVGTPEPQEIPRTTIKNKAPDSLETAAAWSVLSADNVAPTSITWDAMPTNQLVGALKSGRVNAILVTEPTIFTAESQAGAVPVLDAGTGTTANLPLDGYFSTAAYAAANATNVDAFQYALQKAQAEAAQSAPVQAILTSSAGLPGQTAALVTLGTYPTELQVADLKRVATLMFEFSMLPGTGQFNVSSMIPK